MRCSTRSACAAVRTRASGYSLGMKQRLGVAAALLKEPELLILDEPTNGLDPAGMAEMRTFIRSLGDDGRTVVLSSHLMGEVEEVADRVGVINEGALIAEGTVAELRGRPRLRVRAEPAADAVRLIGALPGVDAVTYRDGLLDIAVDPARAPDINRALVEAGVAVAALYAEQPSLEDVFLGLTTRPMICAELLMLRKRAATWVLLGIWTVFGAFVVYGIPYAVDPQPASGDINQFLPQSLAGTALGGFPFLGGVFALMLGVLAFGSEYGWGTLKTLLIQRPGRLGVLGAKLAALGVVLIVFSVALFVTGALVSTVIAHIEGKSVSWPSSWLLVRAVAAGWLILAAWATLGVLLGIATRGTSLAIGIGVLYTVVAEGLLSALTDSIDVLKPLTTVFLRANGYSIAVALGASVDSFESAGPRAYGGPLVSSGQAVAVLLVCASAFLAIAAWLLQRRDVS